MDQEELGYSQAHEKLGRAIRASIDNAWRLHQETYDLEFRTPCATRYFLLSIAQEEAAKAFLLYLIGEEIVLLTAAVRRAINDHACKHLVGMIMDYMIMHWEWIEDLKASISRDIELGNNLPDDVDSAPEILRFEKLGAGSRTTGFGPKTLRMIVKLSSWRMGGATVESRTRSTFELAPMANSLPLQR